jgi:pimeloyl-ACP methyl ester carboxylesterase
VAAPRGDFDARALDVHGHRVIYRIVGTGPPVVLIHGMVNSSRHWKAVAERLAPDYTVIAPDLLGHGDSAKPEGDYSLGAHAAGIRDLLAFLGIDRATMVGHSLGGGVAMQFFYQFPERCERLVLVSSGGLGREVSAPPAARRDARCASGARARGASATGCGNRPCRRSARAADARSERAPARDRARPARVPADPALGDRHDSSA